MLAVRRGDHVLLPPRRHHRSRTPPAV